MITIISLSVLSAFLSYMYYRERKLRIEWQKASGLWKKTAEYRLEESQDLRKNLSFWESYHSIAHQQKSTLN